MAEKKLYHIKAPFDDSNLPINHLTAERMEEIEKLLIPRLDAAFAKLRKEKPHLFKSRKTAEK